MKNTTHSTPKSTSAFQAPPYIPSERLFSKRGEFVLLTCFEPEPGHICYPHLYPVTDASFLLGIRMRIFALRQCANCVRASYMRVQVRHAWHVLRL